LTRYRLPRSLQAKLLAIGLGIGAQGALGWFMVKSGLDEKIITDKAVPRVSQYRLAAHLSAALALYIGMVYTAVGLRRDVKMTGALRSGGSEVLAKLNSLLAMPAVKRYRALVTLAAGMVFFTAASGAFVAGLDAGLVYNEFPTMGGRLVPPTDELLDTRYAKRSDKKDNWWRNMLENPVTAQFDHRLFVSIFFDADLSVLTVRLPLPLQSSSRYHSSLGQGRFDPSCRNQRVA
jgi:cytochrome c oxidase assembly protein subunit 15